MHPKNTCPVRKRKRAAECVNLKSSSPVKRQKSSPGQRRFARLGGPDLSDLRGYPRPEMPNPTPSLSGRSGSNRSRSSRYSSRDAGFENALRDAHIDLSNRGPKPRNWNTLQERLLRPRASLSPSRFSHEAYDRFLSQNDNADSESAVMSNVFPVVLGDGDFAKGQDYPFNNLPPLAPDISVCRPDLFIGARPAQLHPVARGDLKSQVFPSTDFTRPIVPNFFAEIKSANGNASQMRLQLAQDLAIGARCFHELLCYKKDEPVFDNEAHVVGATFQSGSGSLKVYSMHTKPVENGQMGYVFNQLRGYDLTDDIERRQRLGITAFRNLRDWATEERDRVIGYVNETVLKQSEKETGEQQKNGGAAHEGDDDEHCRVEGENNYDENEEEESEEETFQTPEPFSDSNTGDGDGDDDDDQALSSFTAVGRVENTSSSAKRSLETSPSLSPRKSKLRLDPA